MSENEYSVSGFVHNGKLLLDGSPHQQFVYPGDAPDWLQDGVMFRGTATLSFDWELYEWKIVSINISPTGEHIDDYTEEELIDMITEELTDTSNEHINQTASHEHPPLR